MGQLFTIEQLIVGFYVFQSLQRSKNDCIRFVKDGCELHGPEWSSEAFDEAWSRLIDRNWLSVKTHPTGAYAQLNPDCFDDYKDFHLRDVVQEA